MKLGDYNSETVQNFSLNLGSETGTSSKYLTNI